ncbi:porin family protein [Halomonas piscis]|uniref:Porin family protein n=1 Tax=Halomonas piscis TaxID=3031727 RepID=A0ABY9Z0D5_9GAMM|nr:porin family protein [Halomonas piscis]WNK20486.1 porin family protein [Halomonas piscis]
MKKLTLATLTAAVLAAGLATTAQAQQRAQATPYVGADAMFWKLNPDHHSSRNDVGLRVNGGMKFNEFFALEGQLGTGGSDGYADLDYLAGIYAKGILPVTPQARLYGMVGGSRVNADYGGSDSDVSYGAGAEMDIAPNLALGADYMRYLDKSDYTFDAASVGLSYRF